MGGRALPPDISSVLASGLTPGRSSSSSEPASGGASTVAGGTTERSLSSSAELVSAPAHGVAPAGSGAGTPSGGESGDSATPGGSYDGA
ncbi:hypothetical protein RKE29_30140 [Streptomyces sp. B1866]|nr:hypothetical protein [Streptomyces sp. B1866]